MHLTNFIPILLPSFFDNIFYTYPYLLILLGLQQLNLIFSLPFGLLG